MNVLILCMKSCSSSSFFSSGFKRNYNIFAEDLGGISTTYRPSDLGIRLFILISENRLEKGMETLAHWAHGR